MTENTRPRGAKRRGFTAPEREAMRERARELKAEASGKAGKGDGEAEVLAKIAAYPAADRALAERLHALVRAHSTLRPKTWYGMPAYANEKGQVVCFFQSAHRFKTRYATLGFSDKAKLDDGRMWPTSYALQALGPAEEARVLALLRQALSRGGSLKMP